MKAVFKNIHLDIKLKREGFVKFSLFEDAELRQLLTLYNQYNIKDENTYNVHKEKKESLKENDFVLLRDITSPILLEKLKTHTPNLDLLFTEFLVKRPGNSNISAHQDWLFTSRESINTPSLSLFVALSDMDFKDGCLGAISGSHLVQAFSPQPSPYPYADLPLINHRELLFKHMTFTPLKAGEAIMFYNNTVHGSFNNKSDQDRLAIRFALHFKNDDLFHYYLNPLSDSRDEIIQYKVDKDFFPKYRNDLLKEYFTQKKLLPFVEIDRFKYEYNFADEKAIIDILKSLNCSEKNFPQKRTFKRQLLSLLNRN